MIKNRRILLIWVLSQLVISHASAADKKAEEFKPSESDKASVFRVVDQLAKCAGVHQATSWLFEQAGKHESATEFHNLYNGWHMVASYSLWETGVVESWPNAIRYAEGIAETSAQSFKADLEMNPKEGMKRLTKFYEDNCKHLAEFQANKAEEMRKKLASMPNKPKQ